MESNLESRCPRCRSEVSSVAYFCSNCGRALKSRPEDVSIPKQILVYFVSFFLAPFGLGYAFKYLKQADKKSKMIGIISLVLTGLAIVTVIFISIVYIRKEYELIDLINSGGL